MKENQTLKIMFEMFRNHLIETGIPKEFLDQYKDVDFLCKTEKEIRREYELQKRT